MIFSSEEHWKLSRRLLARNLPDSGDFLPSMVTASSDISNAVLQIGDSGFFAESYAQVAPSVPHAVPRKACGLKPGFSKSKKSETHSVRFQPGEWSLVKVKAMLAGVSPNSFIRASTLGSDYKPPIHPELQKLLLATNRELTAQGNNLNQIAKHLHMDKITNDQAVVMIDSIHGPLVRALLTVKNALVQGERQE